MRKVVVVGAGPAGMMAACRAAECGARVVLLDKNEKTGKKLYITGKGRCNLTNACPVEELFESVVHNARFLYSSFYRFSNDMVMDFFKYNGCNLKVERGKRVFPVSDHASDVTRALERRMRQLGVETKLCREAREVALRQGKVSHVILNQGGKEYGDAVIVATGGLSYPSTGSTGDGYRMARRCGHSIVDTAPSLVPFEIRGSIPGQLQGLALKNVRISLRREQKTLYEGFGEMLFTHFGVSGPLVLSASSFYDGKNNNNRYYLNLDLKPALSEEQLDRRILRDFENHHNRCFKNVLTGLFPARLAPVMAECSGIPPERLVHQITREERKRLVALTKSWDLEVTGTREYGEAVITRGGVDVREVNPSTMESKKVEGLYFAGEVLDLDALTGGFNLQIAWSTGYVAGESAAGWEG